MFIGKFSLVRVKVVADCMYCLRRPNSARGLRVWRPWNGM